MGWIRLEDDIPSLAWHCRIVARRDIASYVSWLVGELELELTMN